MNSLRSLRVLLRFLVIGVVNTILGIGVYWLLLYAGLPYQWSSLLSLLFGVVLGYNSHRIAVFKAQGCFLRYVLIWVFIYFVNIELISLIRDYIGDYLSGLAVLPVNATLSFLLMKRFVFRSGKGYSYT